MSRNPVSSPWFLTDPKPESEVHEDMRLNVELLPTSLAPAQPRAAALPPAREAFQAFLARPIPRQGDPATPE